MKGTPRPQLVSTKQLKLAERARRITDEPLLTLHHDIDMDWLREAFRLTRKDGAPGVDGQTAQAYEERLDEHLERLLVEFKTGVYRAPPVKRVYIPKADGKRVRPIGIPTLEDKILQRAVVMLLEPIYEEEFLSCSYGFRRGRSAHDALEALWHQTMSMPQGYLIELDIESFFDRVDRRQLQAMLSQRVGDGVIRRVVGKWLRAGVMEGAQLSYPEAGTPQGGVISPILANLYLHEVLDRWFEEDVKPRLRGRSYVVRYADDAVIGFEHESDARRVMEVLPKRFARYGLTLHPEKTRLRPFQRPGGRQGPGGGSSSLRSFDFLGFTHYWGKSRKGTPIVKRKTASTRLSRSLVAISLWCRFHRHEPVRWQHAVLGRKLLGHYAYYGVTGNGRSLALFRHAVERLWRKWLIRCSRKTRLPWDQFSRYLLQNPLPPPRVVHSQYHRPVRS